MLDDNLLRIGELVLGFAARLGRVDVGNGDQVDAFAALGGCVLVVGPFTNVVNDRLLLVVGDRLAVLGGFAALAFDAALGEGEGVGDAGGDGLGSEEKDGGGEELHDEIFVCVCVCVSVCVMSFVCGECTSVCWMTKSSSKCDEPVDSLYSGLAL